MNSLKLAKFLKERVDSSIRNKEYIKRIDVSFCYEKSYGNEYIKIRYRLTPNKILESLDHVKQTEIINEFQGSSCFIFSISTHTSMFNEDSIVKILEFGNIYESLTSYVALQLEKHFDSAVLVVIQGIDDFTELNHSNKFMRYLIEHYGNYKTLINSSFRSDVVQFESLLLLSKNYRQDYYKNANLFSITDDLLMKNSSLELDSIRQILIDHQVPIHVFGSKTIKSIKIHALSFVTALKERLNNMYRDSYSIEYQKIFEYKSLIVFLYDNFLISEKEMIIRNQTRVYMDNFPIKAGDVIQLKDGRIVLFKEVVINHSLDVNVKFAQLRKNLTEGKRTRVIRATEVVFFAPESLLDIYINQNTIKVLPLFKKWISKRKQNANFKPFIIDYISLISK